MQLVLIGVGEEGVNEAHDGLTAATAAMEDPTIGEAEVSQRHKLFSAVADCIRAHDLFSLCEAPAGATHVEHRAGTSSVLFRLTGAERCGCGVDELRDRWHVDLNRLNAQLLAAVNSDAGPAFLTPVMTPAPAQAPGAGAHRKPELWLCHALGGKLSMASWWDAIVVREAEAIVSRNSAMQAALGAGISCPKGEARLHMMEAGRRMQE